jgi:glycosyltransferase involved in cell wall biosynthesis
MRVVQINFFTSRPENLPPDILNGTPSLVDLARAVHVAGHEVAVIQSCGHDVTLARDGVDFHFLRRDAGSHGVSAAPAFARLIRALQADVFHVHGFGFSDDVRALAQLSPATPILIQDHADRVPRFWRRGPIRRASRGVSGYAFCALEQARPFRDAGLLAAGAPVFEIAEASSRFEPGEREAARQAAQLEGSPALLWVGHLNDNKDPLTMLDGVARAAEVLPDLSLTCCYATAPLLDTVSRRIDGDARLRGRVRLLGRQPPAMIQTLMRGADLYLSASHREGSGFALIEALAAGLPPVVTDIPSFRVLAGAPVREFLWQPGDASDLARRLVAAAAATGPTLRARVRAHFDAAVSYEAIGRRFGAAYGELVRARAA